MSSRSNSRSNQPQSNPSFQSTFSNRSLQSQSYFAKDLFPLLRKGLEDLGFQKTRVIQENDRYLIMIAIGDQSELYEGKWGNFPIIFEAKNGILELRLLLAINSKAAIFNEDTFYIANEFLIRVNYKSDIGHFQWDCVKRQVLYRVIFSCIGLTTKDILEILRKMIGEAIYSYKVYGYGFVKIYENPDQDPIQLIMTCEDRITSVLPRTFHLDDSCESVDRDTRHLNDWYVAVFDSPAQFQAEQDLIKQLEKDDFIKSAFELDGKRISHQMIEYCHMRGVPLVKALVNTDKAYSEIIEDIVLGLFDLGFVFDGIPYKSMVVVKGDIKICYKGKLQEIIIPITDDITEDDLLLNTYSEMTDILCDIMNDPTNYASDIDFIKCSALDVEDDSLEASKTHLKEMLNTDVDLVKIGTDQKIAEEHWSMYNYHLCLNNDSVLRCFGLYRIKSNIYAVFEKCSLTLEEFLHDRDIPKDAQIENKRKDWLMQIVYALKHVYMKEIPFFCVDLGLIMLNKREEIKLKIINHDKARPFWKSPEILQGLIDDKSVIFSLGMIIYYFIVGYNYYEQKIDESNLKTAICEEHIKPIVPWRIEENFSELVDLMRDCLIYKSRNRIAILDVGKRLLNIS